MKHIILAAGEGSASFERNEQIPKCLEIFNGYTTIDHAIEFSENNNNSEICLVGGFEILKIMKKYPSLRYFYNSNWSKTGNLASLLIAIKNFSSDLLITYSDVIYDKSFLKESISSKQISLQYDSEWAYRYENRDKSSVEVLFDTNNQELGEFTGALFIPKTLTKKINKIANDLAQNNNSTLFELAQMILKSFPLDLINVAGGWAEIDSNQDKSRFIFGTKSETLNTLKKNVRHSKILGQYTFQVDEYEKNKYKVIQHIQKVFNYKYLVFRSSALNEDTHKSTMAGNYKSVLNVPRNDKTSIEKSINSVIESYLKSGQKQNPKNQVLVQRFLNGVTSSGVVLTKDLQTDSPYYKINYSEGDDTESVTSGYGMSLKVFICYKYFSEQIKIRKWRN